jgi:CBS domain-containing protein
MARETVTVTPDTPISEAVALMREHKYGALPVVDADGHLAGIVSTIDCLRLLHALLTES